MIHSLPDTAPDWQRAGWPHVWMPYTQMKTALPPFPVVGAEGTRLKLADGRELVDGISSWWTACHGYSHPHLVKALQDQAASLSHVMYAGVNHEPASTLCRRLAGLMPGDLNRVFLVDSGSVSVEVAMKMALQYWINQGVEGRTRFVGFTLGYHGDTTGCMSVCDPEEGMHHMFTGLLPEQFIVDIPRTKDQRADFARFIADHRDEIAAVIIEPLVQGAGGMVFHDADTLAFVARATQENGVLFIADEIMTGFGRTGRMFACEEAEVVPDIVCLSKALTAGMMGLAATVATERVFEAFVDDDPDKCMMHGPTYMANPLGCAVANASLDLFESEPRLDQVADISRALPDLLGECRSIPGVVDVRSRGAIGVVQLEEMRHINWLRARFVEEGVWLRPFRDIVYATPPFVATAQDLEKLASAMARVLGEWAAK